MTNPDATDATVEAPAAEREDVQGHGRPSTFAVADQPTDQDDVEGHGRPHSF